MSARQLHNSTAHFNLQVDLVFKEEQFPVSRLDHYICNVLLFITGRCSKRTSINKQWFTQRQFKS